MISEKKIKKKQEKGKGSVKKILAFDQIGPLSTHVGSWNFEEKKKRKNSEWILKFSDPHFLAPQQI